VDFLVMEVVKYPVRPVATPGVGDLADNPVWSDLLVMAVLLGVWGGALHPA